MTVDFTTTPYKVQSSAAVKLLFYRMLGRMWWIPALPVVTLLVASVVNIAFALVAVMLVLLVYPTLLMFAYFDEALRTEMVRNTSLQQAHIQWPAIHITYIPEGETASQWQDRTVIVDPGTHAWQTRSFLIVEATRHDYVFIPASSMSDEQWMSIALCLDTFEER